MVICGSDLSNTNQCRKVEVEGINKINQNNQLVKLLSTRHQVH